MNPHPNAPHTHDGMAALMGGVRLRRVREAAAAAAGMDQAQKDSHRSAVAKAREEAYVSAMLDFMAASTIKRDQAAMQPDTPDLNTPLPTIG